MATSSFYTILRIETEEQGQALLRAFEEAERRPPKEPMGPSIEERIAEGERLVDEGFFDKLFKGHAAK